MISSPRGERSSRSIKADSLISDTSDLGREDTSPDLGGEDTSPEHEDTSPSPGQARSRRGKKRRGSTVTQEEMDPDRDISRSANIFPYCQL